MKESDKSYSSTPPSLFALDPGKQFLEELWRDDAHVHFLAVSDPSTGQFQTHPVSDLKTLAKTVRGFVSQGKEVYHACACFATVDGGRKTQNAVGAYVFWVDIDCGPTKVESQKGYADENAATQELEAFCSAHGLPQPNATVLSGGGVHAYWILDDLVEREQWREHALKLKGLAAKAGFLADPSRTADIASLLRVPGTLNHKYDPARKVVPTRPIGARIAKASMLQAIQAAWQKHGTPVEVTEQPASNGQKVPEKDHGPLDLQQVASALKVLDPDCDEQTWKLHRLAPLAREALKHPEHAEALQALARDWSSGALSGTPSKQWRIPGSSSGKTGEQAFDAQWRRFSDPDYSGNAATLGTVFFHAKQQGWRYARPAAAQNTPAKTPVAPVAKKGPPAQAAQLDAGPATGTGSGTGNGSGSGNAGKPLPFDEIEPWPHPVDPAELFTEAQDVILRYVVMEPEHAVAVVLWVAHTHMVEGFDTSPLLLINAPERACAKTLLQTLVSWLSFRPLSAANASLSAVFRSIELWQCTLFIDEADTFFKENKELQGVINAGYKRGGFVLRAEPVGDSYEPRSYSVFGPKSIAGIALEKHLTDATMSRGIVINMRRKMVTEKVERVRGAQQRYFAPLAAKFARFAQDCAQQVKEARPDLPAALSDRAQDNWEPLLGIASCGGTQWVDKATQAALKLSVGSKLRGSASNDLLSDIREVLVGWKPHTIKTVDLIDKLCRDPEMGWDTYNRGRPLSPRQLSHYLSVYGLSPRTARQPDGSTPKGYYIAEFEEVFARYLTPLGAPDDGQQETSHTPDVAATAPHSAVPAATALLLPVSDPPRCGVADTSGQTPAATPDDDDSVFDPNEDF